MIIEFCDVSKWFGSRRALAISGLRLGPDQLFVISGANGAGKSVLLKLLAGIITPTEGAITWDGRSIEDRLITYKFRIGYMPQQPSFYEEHSVSKCLHYFGRLKAIPEQLLGRRVAVIIDQMRLTGMTRQPIKELSGGERSRLALGIALLNDPDVLLLDEPGANLDPEEQRDLWALVDQLRPGRTIALATHIYAGLEGIADRLLLLEEGDLIRDVSVTVLLSEVAPYVWTVTDHAFGPPPWAKKCIIVGSRRTEGATQWRVLAAERPVEHAVNVPPTLEDAYLWVRREER